MADDDPNPMYYRLYLHDGRVGVVTMQWFDEMDYHDHKFVRDESGERLRFAEEMDARRFLNRAFKREAIHPDDLLPCHPSFLIGGDEAALRAADCGDS